ncbi:MAG: methylmalonyl Co-A mutase-associated GTPase MeaB [Ignavibacteriae bacterium]|nr:MAG: methylmalonyl Co-A mutase-associated GTPase MeaB [Ignavibacteriota bacterium]
MDGLAEELVAGNRRALAQAISLVESTASSDQDLAAALLTTLNTTPPSTPSRRIAVSGAPGVGKSTLLEQLGLQLIDHGHTVAILAVDPTSKRTGGSILGDKVRMPKLSTHDQAFIRPSPSRRSLGGAAAATRDVMTLCEAAGYDTIIVETVGVGQSETEAADMVDLFLLLVMPAAGDDLQGIKRGIMEVADAVVVTKSDLSRETTNVTVAQLRSALQLMQPSRQGWETPVAAVSSVTASGLDELLNVINRFFASERRTMIDDVRQAQRLAWFDELVRRRLVDLLTSHPPLQSRLAILRNNVHEHCVPPTVAVREFLTHLTVSITEQP